MGWVGAWKCELIEDGLNSPCARLIDWENGLIMKPWWSAYKWFFIVRYEKSKPIGLGEEQVNSHDFLYTILKMLIKENYCSVNQKRGWGFQHVQSAYVVVLLNLGVIQDTLKGLPENMSSFPTIIYDFFCYVDRRTKETLQFFQPICFLIQTGYLQPFRTS